MDAMIIPFRRMRKHSIPAFIEQTWKMLEEPENWDTIGWGAD
jgi:mannosyltransferase OCH1-like enzyme